MPSPSRPPEAPAAGAATLLLDRSQVMRMLSPVLCISAVEEALRRSALGELAASGILGMQAGDGSFHVKAGLLAAGDPYFAAKVNANFPHNPARCGLPTIQGAVLLFHAGDGRLLAIMDSMALTALRTAAATAIAAKYLARADCDTLLICGCGAQALEQLRAVLCVRQPVRLLAYDADAAKARSFALTAEKSLGIGVRPVADVRAAMPESDIVITCTTATAPFVTPELIQPGTFIAAVGADHEHKQEISPALMAQSRVVTDSTAQASRIGDLHHAIAQGAMTASAVHGELAEIAAGLKPGRRHEREITLFDSTGLGLQDVAAAVALYQCASRHEDVAAISFVG